MDAKNEGIREAWAWCARMARLRAIMWTEADDRRSQDFRDGVEKACHDLSECFTSHVNATSPQDDTPTGYNAVGELFPLLRMETDAEMKQPNPTPPPTAPSR